MKTPIGYLDKKGNPINIGDILLYRSYEIEGYEDIDSDEYEDYVEEIDNYVIVLRDSISNFTLKDIKNSYVWSARQFLFEDYEIVGNIYEDDYLKFKYENNLF
ncbi:TPA: hypothetical protein R1765_001975 [Campylobacter coli]|nr:hypothetical protein [Campylobacter coli]